MSSTAPSTTRGRTRFSIAILATTVFTMVALVPGSADARLYDMRDESMLLGLSDRSAVSMAAEIGLDGRFNLDSAMAAEGVGAVEYMTEAAEEDTMKQAPEPEAAAEAAQDPETPAEAAPAPKPATASKASSSQSSSAYKKALCTWYGPGLYGNRTADGTVLKEDSMVLAHRTLPFGTKVEVKYKGKTVVGTVRDRGPKSTRFEFDLGPGVAKALDFSGVQAVEYRILK